MTEVAGRQGHVVSPWVYTVYTQGVAREDNAGHIERASWSALSWRGANVALLLYANDAALPDDLVASVVVTGKS